MYFPYILSQLSIQEFEHLENAYSAKTKYVKKAEDEIGVTVKNKDLEIDRLRGVITDLDYKYGELDSNDLSNYNKYLEIKNAQENYERFVYKTKKLDEAFRTSGNIRFITHREI